MVGIPAIILVQERDQIAMSMIDADVPGSGLTGVRLLNQANLVILGKAPDFLGTVIRRAVVNHDDLICRQGLGDDTSKSLLDEIFTVYNGITPKSQGTRVETEAQVMSLLLRQHGFQLGNLVQTGVGPRQIAGSQ